MREVGHRRAVHVSRQRLGGSLIGVMDRQMPNVERLQRMGNRAPGPAGAEQENMVHLRTGQSPAQALGEAPEISIVSVAFSIAEDDGVDRADLAGGVGQGVEQLDHRALVGEGDVEPGKPGGLGSVEHLGKARLGALHCIGVEQLVAQRKPLRPALGHMHRRGARKLDAFADKPHTHKRRPFGRALIRAVVEQAEAHVRCPPMPRPESAKARSECSRRLILSTTLYWLVNSNHATTGVGQGGRP